MRFPADCPLVLVGENNAGKSNIVKAIQLLLGPFWPGNHEPEDHEFFGRTKASPISIKLGFDSSDPLGGHLTLIEWRYDNASSPPQSFLGQDTSGREGRYIKNDDRDTCACVVVEADRNLNYQLSYSSKWTLLSRLMTRFHRALEQKEDVRGDLEALFTAVRDKFHEIPEFSLFVSGLKEQMEEMVASMSHKLAVDFQAYDPTKFFHALRLQAMEGEVTRTLDEMGTGEQQVLAMAFAHAFAKAFHGGILLVIEEPESHLHPLAQQWLAHRLAKMMTDGVQVILTTHSAAFIDILNLEGLALVRKDAEGTYIKQLTKAELRDTCVAMGASPTRTTTANILPFYSANANREILEGFFAKVVVLVEGPTESLTLPIYLEKAGLKPAKNGIAIIPVQGKGNLGKWRRLFLAYDIPTYVIFDNDTTDDANGSKRKDALSAVGITDEATISRLLASDDCLIASDYAVFGKDFETYLRAVFPTYAALEGAAKAEGIDSKPFLARSVADRLSYRADADEWQSFQRLASELRSKLPADAAVPAADTSDNSEPPF